MLRGVRHVNGALTEGFAGVALLIDDGVWLARKGQSAGETRFTSLSDAVTAALQKAGGPVPRVAVHSPSLHERGLSPEELILGVELVDDAGVAESPSARGAFRLVRKLAAEGHQVTLGLLEDGVLGVTGDIPAVPRKDCAAVVVLADDLTLRGFNPESLNSDCQLCS